MVFDPDTVPLNAGEGIVIDPGSVVLSNGAPPELVTKTALFTGEMKLVAPDPV
jgi:hypothetical protein